MSAYPIIFSDPMPRALLDGRKTMTRRLAWRTSHRPGAMGPTPTPWQKRKPGDLLWVREAFATTGGGPVRYYATDHVHELRRKRPSIHMPRWASRLTLEITETRIERLQDISEADALAEGMTFPEGMYYGSCPRSAFAGLWRDLHGPGAWEANPEVVALTFKVHHANVDSVTEAAAA